MWLNVIQARLNTRQYWPAVSTTNCMWGSLGLQQGFGNFIALSQKSIICSRYLCMQQPQLFLPPASPALWMFVLVLVSELFSTEVLTPKCDGAGGCFSEGHFAYLLGLLAAPFSFTRRLPHTHLSSMLLNSFLTNISSMWVWKSTYKIPLYPYFCPKIL